MAFTLGSSSGKNPSALCTLTGIRLRSSQSGFLKLSGVGASNTAV